MRSQHVDYYNHDNLASDYDQDVKRTDDPIRDGYDGVLDWVVTAAGIDETTSVLELGSGTGNLTQRIKSCARIICVDISTKMEEQGKDKVAHLTNREFAVSDVLEYVAGSDETFDVIVSTYTLHHLTEEEKMPFLEAVRDRLKPGGRFVVGDLMTKSVEDEQATIAFYREQGDENTAGDIEEEFFWYVDSATEKLTSLKLEVETARFSRLSWCIKASKLAC
jgi:ubiquinone/menaquinone biosynthesis C-methylase UbiE